MRFCDHLVKEKIFNSEIYLCKLYNYDVIHSQLSCSEHGPLLCYTDIKKQRKQKLKKLNASK